MANNLDSNITRQLLRVFLKNFETQRVLSKTVNTQLFQGRFNPSSGDYVDIKRPHQYLAKRTAGGDISALTANSIISGKASAQVQNYITIDIDWTNKEEALSLDQLNEIISPAAQQCTIELETSFCDFMIANAGLSIGTPGTAIDAWSDIASQMSLMKSLGVPGMPYYSVVNPYTIQNLASAQTGLSADPSRLVQTAWENAQIASPFAGLRVVSSNALSTWTTTDLTDLSGTVTSPPTATYVSVKDTMKQTVAVENLTDASATIKAGDIIEYTGTGADARSFVNPRTQKTIFDGTGAPVKFRQVVTADATVTTGAASLSVAGPAIYEASGQYNNISAALTTGDAFTILGTASTEYQPNLFYVPDAFAIAFVKIPKLYSTDTIAVTNDGISIRCSKYSDGDANTQKIRFDLLPAFGVMNPFWAGKGFGL